MNSFPRRKCISHVFKYSNNSMKNDLSVLLLYILPIYHCFVSTTKDCILNYHKIICSEVVDKIISVTKHDKEIREVDDYHDGSKNKLVQMNLKRLN